MEGYEIKRIPVEQQTEEMCIECCKYPVSKIVCKTGFTIRHPLNYCSIRTPNVLKTAYRWGGEHRFCIFDLMTEDEQASIYDDLIDALNRTPSVYPYIKKPTREQKLMMAAYKVSAIDYLPKPIPFDIQAMLIECDPMTIIHISNPSLEIKLKAVRLQPRIILFLLPNAETELKAEALMLDPSLKKFLR